MTDDLKEKNKDVKISMKMSVEQWLVGVVSHVEDWHGQNNSWRLEVFRVTMMGEGFLGRGARTNPQHQL